VSERATDGCDGSSIVRLADGLKHSAMSASANANSSASALLDVLHQAGRVRLAELPFILAATQNYLITAPVTCDGVTLAGTLPVFYSVNPSVVSFADTITVIGFVATVTALVYLASERNHPAIASANLPLTSVSTVGLALLFVCLEQLTANATASSCSLLIWLVNLGYTVLFVPIFLKIVRVYGMFGGGALRSKTHCLSSITMLLIMASALLLDFAILGIWQGVAPFEPMTSITITGTPPLQTIYTQCGQGSNGLPFVYVVGLIKGMALFLASIICFAIRRVVTSFNEQRYNALVVYNAVLAVSLCVPIALVSSVIGDGLVLLFVICIAWVALFAVITLFVSKIFSARNSKREAEKKKREASFGESERNESIGFEFCNIGFMKEDEMAAYSSVLETQVLAVRDRMTSLGTAMDKSSSRPRNEGGEHC